MKTVLIRKEDVKRRWIQFDASGQTLGKLAVRAARLLIGKDKPTITPGVDTGDFVLVTNAKDVKVSGNKEEGKIYRKHTGWVGGLVEQPLADLRAKKPEAIVQLAVKRMLPKNRLGAHMIHRLKVYPGSDHPHEAQKPEKAEV